MSHCDFRKSQRSSNFYATILKLNRVECRCTALFRSHWVFLFNWRVISLGTYTQRSWVALRHALDSIRPWFIAAGCWGHIAGGQSSQKVRRDLAAGAEIPNKITHELRGALIFPLPLPLLSRSSTTKPCWWWWWPAGNIPQTSNLWAPSRPSCPTCPPCPSCPAAICWHSRDGEEENQTKTPKQTATNTKLNKTAKQRNNKSPKVKVLLTRPNTTKNVYDNGI